MERIVAFWEISFDSALALVLTWLAWQVLHGPNLFRAVICFMVFGLLLSLVWVRLEAFDIALAETAISTGLTGALLLSTLGRLHDRYAIPEKLIRRRKQRLWLWSNALLWTPPILLLVVFLILSTWLLPAPGLGEEVKATLTLSGVENPVTAVLLNFRAFDTLLEIAVLLLAVVACWSFGPASSPIAPHVPSPTLPALVRLLFPIFLLVATYLLWRGTHAPGGAFQAGAVLGAGGVLLIIAGGRPWSHTDNEGWSRGVLVLGLAVFLAIAVGVMFTGKAFLQYPPGWSRPLIILIEVTATITIAGILLALYIGGQPPLRRSKDPKK
jgi:multisubunit Na+/H+ antiporter MnhB subunit